MGKAMVNATNLVAHVTIVAHLNLKTTVAFATTSCGHQVAIWHHPDNSMGVKPYNPNPNLCHVYNDIAWLIKL